MGFRDLIGVRKARSDTLAGTGAAKGAGYAGLGEGLAAGVNKYADYRGQKALQGESEAAQLERQKEQEAWSSGESKAQFERTHGVEAENARALQDTLNMLRGGSDQAADVGAADVAGVLGKAPPTSGTGGPSSPALAKLTGFSDVHATEAAYRALVEDEERRRRYGLEARDFKAGAAAWDAARAGPAENPLAAVPGEAAAGAAHGGYMDDVGRAAAALRESGYEDPIRETDTMRRRNTEDVMRPIAARRGEAEIGATQAEAAARSAQAAASLRTAAQPLKPPITAGEISRLLATTTGRQHEQIRALNRELEAARKSTLDPMVRGERRAAAQAMVQHLSDQIRAVQTESDATMENWMGVLRKSFPQLNIPDMGPEVVTPTEGGGADWQNFR